MKDNLSCIAWVSIALSLSAIAFQSWLMLGASSVLYLIYAALWIAADLGDTDV